MTTSARIESDVHEMQNVKISEHFEDSAQGYMYAAFIGLALAGLFLATSARSGKIPGSEIAAAFGNYVGIDRPLGSFPLEDSSTADITSLGE